jgi:hypothetical protein
MRASSTLLALMIRSEEKFKTVLNDSSRIGGVEATEGYRIRNVLIGHGEAWIVEEVEEFNTELYLHLISDGGVLEY